MSISYILEVEAIIQQGIIQKYIQVAICSVLVADTLITIDKEIKYFWTRHWCNLTHIIFFVNRYVGIFGAISRLICLFGDWAGTVADVLIVIIIDYILIIRVLAIWHNKKILAIVLYTVLLCEVVLKIIFAGVGRALEGSEPVYISSGFEFCGTQTTQSSERLAAALQLSDWIITAVIGLFLLGLALYKSNEHWKLSGMKKFDLINVMVKDQIIYYLLVLFCSAVNIALAYYVFIDSGPGMAQAILNLIGSPSFLCLLGSRMYFNLKEGAEILVNEGSNLRGHETPASTISVPRFAGPVGSSFGLEMSAIPDQETSASAT